ncbi:hypothetical protein [Caulobacter sp. 17J65-9]|uniref:hypothetical protein n=1 Tax=Caulobacter sp. 17J65-9 TaxID=2709382 RepID=UPI0013C8D588|nr:hypothetical protein [Caulobacter sp. 17J65-9]NEX93934.1 hypothetical protein [Caulobacter sp. 17J65-9]
MRRRRLLAIVVASVVGLVAPAAQAGPAPDPKAGVVVQTWRAGPTIHSTDWSWPSARFLYDAAMSGRFGPIETRVWLNGSERVRRWERIDDFDACAEILGAGDVDVFDTPLVGLQDWWSEEGLVQGRCVVGRLVPEVSGGYVASYAGRRSWGLVLKRRADGRRVGRSPDGIWTLFGLAEPPFDRGPDQVDDDTLIRALLGPARMREAAGYVIRARASDGRTTSRRVGQALADSGLLRAEAPEVRAAAIRTAAAIPGSVDLLLPEILAGLDEPAEPIRYTEARLSGALDADAPAPGGGPGGHHPMIAQAGAEAAVRLGPQALAQIWPRIEPPAMRALERNDLGVFVSALRGLCGVDPGRVAALAAAYPTIAAVQAAADACPAPAR